MLVTEGLTGRTAAAHGWTTERVFAIPSMAGAGMGVETLRQPPGRFQMPGENAEYPGFAPGSYALFTLGFDTIPAFSLRKDVQLSPEAGLDDLELKTPAHYAVIFDKSAQEWGKSPYMPGTDFYQTFAAAGPHITRIATKLADKSGDHAHLTLNYAIYEPNEAPPSTWKRVSPVRSRTYAGNVDPIIHIYHVTYRSDEIELTPGKTYAVRFWRDPRSKAETFAIVARPDKGDGYRLGQLYQGDTPRPDWDAYAYISGGEPGTIVNHAPVGDLELKRFAGTARRFGQTFRASGTGLAGADIVYTNGKIRPPSWPITFQAYDRPGGKPIGPARTCYGIPMAYQARAAAVWMPGEIPLTPGRMYYLEWTAPTGCNTWVLNEDLPGEAYRDGKALPDSDLALSLVEYERSGAAARPAPQESR